MNIGLLVFPTLYNTHSKESASSDLGQRLEPSVLSLVSKREGDVSEFIADNQPREHIDLYLCSVYTRGWHEFCEFSKKVGREKIIAGGYHPTARPLETSMYAKKVVTGLCGNIEEILDMPNGGVIPGKAVHRLMDRSLLKMEDMQQVYPDVMPHMNVGSSVSSVGCPYDCDFCATPQMSGRKMTAYDVELIEEDIANLKKYNTNAVFIRDESFATHPNFDQAVKLYGEANFDVLYSFGTAAAMNERKIKTLADSNWHSLCLGLEDVHTTYKKNKTLLSVSEMCQKYDVGLTLSFIINDENKTLDDMIKNYQALTQAFFELNPVMVCANFFMPLPGTKLGDSMKERVNKEMWKKFDSKTPLFAPIELEYLHRQLAIAVQLNWYRSKQYAKIRDFECGDTLHLRMLELEKSFGFENGIPQYILDYIRNK
jgi:radical SAM superfamily enzyme YgiQ (UPF0313 family)